MKQQKFQSESEFITHHQINTWGESTVIMHFKGLAVGHIYRYHDDKKVVYIEGLNVSENFRGNGMGRKLLHLLEEMRYPGSIILNLWVIKDSWMHEWYKREGYSDLCVHSEEEKTVWMEKVVG